MSSKSNSNKGQSRQNGDAKAKFGKNSTEKQRVRLIRDREKEEQRERDNAAILLGRLQSINSAQEEREKKIRAVKRHNRVLMSRLSITKPQQKSPVIA